MLVRPLRLAYGLIGAFVFAERLLRRGKDATSLAAGKADQGTTRALGIAFGVSFLALLMAPILNRQRIGRIPASPLAWGGIAAMAAGLGIRIWAARALGAFYTRTLRTSARQHIVAAGPYRRVRHPGYLGSLLLWLGAGMAGANWLAVVAIALSMGRAYRLRILAEEAMLSDARPEEYAKYAARTWRLVPFLY